MKRAYLRTPYISACLLNLDQRFLLPVRVLEQDRWIYSWEQWRTYFNAISSVVMLSSAFERTFLKQPFVRCTTPWLFFLSWAGLRARRGSFCCAVAIAEKKTFLGLPCSTVNFLWAGDNCDRGVHVCITHCICREHKWSSWMCELLTPVESMTENVTW